MALIIQNLNQYVDTLRYEFGPKGSICLLVMAAFLLFMAIEVVQVLFRLIFRRVS